MRTAAGGWILALLVGGALSAVLLPTVVRIPSTTVSAADPTFQAAMAKTTTRLGMGLLGVRTDQLDPASDPTRLFRTPGYLLVFEILSVHLLVVLVGAAYLARAKRKRG